jgi:uncharacterized protein (TIGR03118 family)
MNGMFKATKLLFAAVVAASLVPSYALAQHYTQKNLVSDLAQPNNADGSKVLVDPNLKNPWGLTRSAGSPFWIGNNNSGTSSLYGNGNPINIFPDPPGSVFDNFIFVPPPKFAATGTPSTPTGVVFNGSATDFLLDKGTPANLQAIFIFSTEDGTISGWNPGANVAAGAKPPSINAVLEVDNSDNGSAKGAVYKGATTAEFNGKKFLYVTNFRSGRVEVYDSSFKPTHFSDDAFDADGDGDGDRDDRGDHDGDHIPRGFAPFNIQNIGGSLFVTYAKQDALRHDPVGGDGFGFVEIFTPDGKHIGHLQHGPWMNAPWGVVWTPRDFGTFSNSILVGNFRSGWIAAFNGFTHKFEGFVRNPDNSLVFIDGLWSLTFGNNGAAGSSNTLFFTAGLNGEQDGLFGTLTPVAAEEDGSIE